MQGCTEDAPSGRRDVWLQRTPGGYFKSVVIFAKSLRRAGTWKCLQLDGTGGVDSCLPC